MGDSASLLQEGRAHEALAALKGEVRDRPSDVELRVRLFALHCVLGRWDKAANDLAALVALDASWAIPARVYHRAMDAELLRRDVFAGRVKPLVMGEPEEWLAWNVQALVLEAEGKPAEALELQRQAFESAPEYPCKVDGRACQWLSDADRRIGPVLEACLDGKYYWIPFGQLQKIEITPPEYLVEVVWVPAKLTVCGGAELAAQLPARYPGTESSSDGGICLGRRTEWLEIPGGGNRPVGQKLIGSETADFGLLSCRIIEFAPREEVASPA
jgi:type VI secretion system protein ImpE